MLQKVVEVLANFMLQNKVWEIAKEWDFQLQPQKQKICRTWTNKPQQNDKCIIFWKLIQPRFVYGPTWSVHFSIM